METSHTSALLVLDWLALDPPKYWGIMGSESLFSRLAIASVAVYVYEDSEQGSALTLSRLIRSTRLEKLSTCTLALDPETLLSGIKLIGA